MAESHSFDVAGFVGTLEEALGVADPLKRQFLLGWLRCAAAVDSSIAAAECMQWGGRWQASARLAWPPSLLLWRCWRPPRYPPRRRSLLDSLPDVDLAAHLPALLPGLLGMLSDGNAEIRSACTKLLHVRGARGAVACPRAAVLDLTRRPPACRGLPSPPHSRLPQEFLIEVQTSAAGTAEIGQLSLILAQQLAQRADDEAALLTSLRWLHALAQQAPAQLLPHTAELLREVLPCLGHAGECYGSWQPCEVGSHC